MSASSSFIDELRSGVLIGDGAVGTTLFARGASLKEGIERLNLTAPDRVKSLHSDYIAAGSRVIETNTFGANRPKLAQYGVEDHLTDILRAGVEIAKSIKPNDVRVAGSIGPLPLVDGEPLGEKERKDAFAEIVSALLDGGVDLLIFETFTDVKQLIDAVTIGRGMTGLPIVAQMAFEPEGRLPGGASIDCFAESVLDAGADVIGANCGAGIPAVRDAVKRLVSYGAPVSAFMNAGFAERIEDRTLFVAPNDYLASTAVELVRHGARLIGGCCGTTPETIGAIAKALKDAETSAGLPEIRITERARPRIAPKERTEPVVPTGILVELDPPKTMDIDPLITAASKLKAAGASAVTLADNPLASVRLDTLTVAGAIIRETGMAVIPHLTGRDRNRIALQSTIMGAHVSGVHSLICVTGDPVRMYNETNTSGVFDVTSIGLTKLVAEFNAGERGGGDDGTSFAIGVAYNPNVRNIQSQTGKLIRKIDAGAHYALTQPIFTKERLDMLEKSIAENNVTIPVFTGIMPLMSARNAEFLHNEVPGIYIPDEYRNRLASFPDKKDQRKAGIEIAVELAEMATGRTGGLYLITPRNNTAYVLPIIEAVGVK